MEWAGSGRAAPNMLISLSAHPKEEIEERALSSENKQRKKKPRFWLPGGEPRESQEHIISIRSLYSTGEIDRSGTVPGVSRDRD